MKPTKMNLFADGRCLVSGIDRFSHIYLPLFNVKGMKSSISPTMGGDMKIDQNHFGLAPVSALDLQESRLGRNVFFLVDGDVWSITGATPFQKLHPDKVDLEIGILYQKITRSNLRFETVTTSFVPTNDLTGELHRITFTNRSDKNLTVKPVVGIPIFGRSADNIRDHRHVTSLLNRVTIAQNGIVNMPTLSFDERGHVVNTTAYGVFSSSDRQDHVAQYWPFIQEFVGEGGDLFYPLSVRENWESLHHVGDVCAGYEVIGGLEYDELTIHPRETLTLTIAFQIGNGVEACVTEAKKVLADGEFDRLFSEMTAFWKQETITPTFQFGSPELTGWLKWVGMQPIMRRLYGCSFLPDHDYGRGGRGWRDLWQDSLAYVLKNPEHVKRSILNNMSGIRIDGSNATIIGLKRGEFLADRNHIVRVWSDHGAWPLLTVNYYIDHTGDTGILFESQCYFKDKFASYTKEIDEAFLPAEGNLLKDRNGQLYSGSILEHLLLENVVPFYNVGAHNIIRLEDADWNDGMDMATENGETVAFHAFYAGNLQRLANLLEQLKNQDGLRTVTVLKEAEILFDTLKDPIDYRDGTAKKNLLKTYFQTVRSRISGQTVTLDAENLIADLRAKSAFMKKQLNEQEWVEAEAKEAGWYNGYYDNAGHPVDSAKSSPVRMTLTGQVFPLMNRLVPEDRLGQIIKGVETNLLDAKTRCLRLNTPLDDGKMNLGRFTGFAYGHKENGAMFSHMAVMYAFSLFENGRAVEGNRVIDRLFEYTSDIEKAGILPGIPEYIDPLGRGMYHYLTGSASWVVITFVDQIFGCRGVFGDLVLEPKLSAKHFAGGDVSIVLFVNGQPVKITYSNPDRLEAGTYRILRVEIDDKASECYEKSFRIRKNRITKPLEINVTLGK